MKTHIFDSDEGLQAFKMIYTSYVIHILERGKWINYREYNDLGAAVTACTVAKDAGHRVCLTAEQILEYHSPAEPSSINQNPYADGFDIDQQNLYGWVGLARHGTGSPFQIDLIEG